MSSKTGVRREGFKALIEMKRFPECAPGWDPILHDLQGDPIDTWGSKPKYDPLESDDKWIQNVKDLLTREGVPEAEQPQKAVKFIANPTISTELGVAMEDVIKRYGHIEWGWFERFMVEFQKEIEKLKSEVENDTEGIMDAAGSMHPAATAGLDYYSYVFVSVGALIRRMIYGTDGNGLFRFMCPPSTRDINNSLRL